MFTRYYEGYEERNEGHGEQHAGCGELVAMEHPSYGRIVLQRLALVGAPRSLVVPTAAFRKAHVGFVVAAAAADAAWARRDRASDAQSRADQKLDEALAELVRVAGAAGAKLPNGLVEAPYATLPALLADAAWEGATSRSVARALERARRRGEAAAVAARAVIDRATAHARATARRDELRAIRDRSLRALERRASAAWEDGGETYAAVFAPVEAQPPRRRRAAT